MKTYEKLIQDKKVLEDKVKELGLEEAIASFLSDCGSLMPAGYSPEMAAKEIVAVASEYTTAMATQTGRGEFFSDEEIREAIAEQLKGMDYAQSESYLSRLLLANRYFCARELPDRAALEREFDDLQNELKDLSDQGKVDVLMQQLLQSTPDMLTMLVVDGSDLDMEPMEVPEADPKLVQMDGIGNIDCRTAAVCGAVLYRGQLMYGDQTAGSSPGAVTLQQAALYDTAVAVARAADPVKTEEACMEIGAIGKSVAYVLSILISASGFVASCIPSFFCIKMLDYIVEQEMMNVCLRFLLGTSINIGILISICIFIYGGLLFLEGRSDFEQGLLNLGQKLMASPAQSASGHTVMV